MPGTSLVGCKVGPYELTHQIARGGMGVVYRARHIDLNREVAVKLIGSGVLASDEELRRFRQEAEAAAQLRHPNIIPIYDVGNWQGQAYFSMTLVEGPSLEDWVRSRKCTVDQAAGVVRDIARAVAYAHSQSIIHRDLKPANILIDGDGKPMLTDFGLAKYHREGTALTLTGQILGTPNYMSPEQAEGQANVGPLSDVYALGAVLYALLTGQPPHCGDSAPQILTRVLGCDPVPPREINRDIPMDLQRICMECLHRDPQDRYASANEFANDLDCFLKGEPISAGQSGVLDELVRTLRRDQHHQHFRNWGTALHWMGWMIFAAHLVMFCLARFGYHDSLTYWTPRLIMAAGLVGIVHYYRSGVLRARSVAERPIWSIWIGYLVSLATMNIVLTLHGTSQLEVFPIASALAAFGFIALAGHVWGGCYLLGGLFVGCSLLSAFVGSWGILMFGACWLISLATLGFRYRRDTTNS
ncbi:MAG: serine/threonine-protein kinase [Pirellulaceae bacterium]